MRGQSIHYSAEELQWVSDHRTLVIGDLHAQFCDRFQRIDVKPPHLHALRKRKGWKTGRTGQYEKGNIPLPTARPKGPNKGSFKKGNRPHTWLPIGTERITKDGYREVKVTDTGVTRVDFVALHRLNWEREHGAIPEGSVVIFRDGDRLNCELDNLLMVTRAELAVMNRMGLNNTPSEMKETARLVAQLRIKVNQVRKQA